MSQEHHPDAIEQNIDSHPLQIAIGIVIVAAATIVGIILLVQFAIGSYGARSLKNDPAMRPERVEERIAPVAQVAIDPNAPAVPPAPEAPAAAPAPAAAVPPPAAPAAGAKSADAGKKTFETVCTACHGTGVLGAPKFGDKAAWAPRIATGLDTLHNSALHGKNAMPPKGGNLALTDADVTAAVDYMAGAAK